jgi:hypothetical protein
MHLMAFMTLDDMKKGVSPQFSRFWIKCHQKMRSYYDSEDKYEKSWNSAGLVVNTNMDRFKIEEIIEGVAYLSFQYVSNAKGE